MDLQRFFAEFKFVPVVHLPKDYEVYDFTKGYNPDRMRSGEYGVGRYDEQRKDMYSTNLFNKVGQETRDVHVGIDLAAPVGSNVFAFFSGVVLFSGINSAAGDYGGTLITEHQLIGKSESRTLYALFGHLSHKSVRDNSPGRKFSAGEVLAQIGDRTENGGWNPHLHFQLSWIKPTQCDLPGVVSMSNRAQALKDFPDPRLVLGPVY